MDRRTRKRVAPKDPLKVTLTLSSATLDGLVWDISPSGAKLLLEHGSLPIDLESLGNLLGHEDRYRLCLRGEQEPVALVWLGCAGEPRSSAGTGLAVGVEFTRLLRLDEVPGTAPAPPLGLLGVRHRSVRDLGVAVALRDLFLAAGNGEFSLDAALQLLCEKLRELTGAEIVDFWALDGAHMILRAQAGETRLPRGSRLPPGRGSLAENFSFFKSRIQRGEQLFTNDLAHSPLAGHPWVRRFGIQSAMIIPVFGREVDLGVLAFGHSRNPHAFGPRQQAEAEIFASQAALFFEKASMFRDLQDWAGFLGAMNRIALAFHRRLDTGRVLEVICKETRELFHVDIATIFLREDGGYVQHAACGMEVGRSRIERSEAALPESELVDQGEAFFINDFEDHPISRMEIVRRYMGRRPARSMMVIPILDNDRVLGTLTLADRRDPKRFTARDIDKGKLLGQQAAQAIVNARLYERVDQSKRIIRQQDRFRILGELAGVVAHEIKNALVPLRTLVDLLPRRYDDADFREWYAKTVCQEVERMHGLVLQLSRFRGAENRVVESNDSVALLSSVVELIRPEAMGRQIEIDLEAESNLPNIDVVANEIRQVLLNLILNAVQAVDEKGTVRVGVRRGDDGSGILFWVSDTGPGIAPENVEKIFDPLYTSKKDGSGLGLAVARDLVQAHGGTIRVESQPGKGATFVVLFPGVAGRAESPIVIR